MGSLTALLLLCFMNDTALAAPLNNDIAAGATPAAIGVRETLDTSEATTDGDDAQLNAACGAPATDASVWYAVQGTGQGIVVDVAESRYSAGVMVGVGSPGNLSLVTCGANGVAFVAAANTTYYVIVFDDQADGGGNGGTLNIAFEAIPPPPKVTVSVDPYGTVNIQTGVATISGIYTCTHGDSINVTVNASQNVGRFTVSGSGAFSRANTCDGAPHAWSANVVPENGKFAGGKSLALTFSYACSYFECGTGYTEQTVQLRGGAQ